MKKIFQSLSIILSIVFIVGIGIVINTVPDKHGEHKFAGLSSDVKVYYDQYGIPHIEASNDLDGYKALGFVMASDRLFQMDLMRRIVNGELSEIFGERTINSDILLRKLMFKRSANRVYEKYKSTQTRMAFNQMEAFIAGIQHFIATKPLPIEFHILGYKPRPFEVSELIGVAGYMALTFAEGINSDVLITDLMNTLPEDKLSVIRSGAGSDVNYFSDQKIVKKDFLKNFNKSLEEINGILPLFEGSNSWVLSGSRTNTGMPILANDPHIATGNPHIFFEAHLKIPSLEVYGNYIPLLPFPVMGHTAHNAWGLTMAEVDDLTIYEEKFNPENIDQVMFNNEWTDVQKLSEVIKVKDKNDVNVEIILTPHGPLLDDTDFNSKGKRLALHWSVHHPDNNVVQSLYELPRAKTVEEFKHAVSHAAAPGLNVSYVNNSGDIAWWMMGKFPKLPEGIAYDQVLKGWDGSHEVERYYSIDENPHLVNPENGAIVTANYRPQQPEFSHFDGYWQPAGRYFRIEKLLSQKEKWSLEELKKIQTDVKIPIAQRLQAKLFLGVNQDKLTTEEKKVFSFLKSWDGESDKKSIGSSIYHLWNYKLFREIFVDELGEEGYKKLGKTADFWHSFKQLVADQNHSFWDDIRTDRVESGSQIITRTFKATVLDLNKRFGSNMNYWKWGSLHTVEYKHPLGKVKPLNLIFNIGPISAPGSRYVINNLGHKVSDEGFHIVHQPATRRLVGMSNPNSSFGILPTGNSGNPFSDHFQDQAQMYHNSIYREQIMDFDKLRKIVPLVLKANN